MLTECLGVEAQARFWAIAKPDGWYATLSSPLADSGLFDSQILPSSSSVKEWRKIPESLSDQLCHALKNAWGDGVDHTIGDLIEAAREMVHGPSHAPLRS